MLHAVLKADTDSRCGREHVFGILVFSKKGGPSTPAKATKSQSTHMTRQAAVGSRKHSLASGSLLFHVSDDNGASRELKGAAFNPLVFAFTENQYPRHSDTIGGLPPPATTMCYTIKADAAAIAKYSGNLKADPIPFALLDELFQRYLSHYETGIL